jgi:Mn-dependent DtxR family transcriptional regulator
VLRALAPWPMRTEDVCLWIGRSAPVVEEKLNRLAQAGLVERVELGWRLTDEGIHGAAQRYDWEG